MSSDTLLHSAATEAKVEVLQIPKSETELDVEEVVRILKLVKEMKCSTYVRSGMITHCHDMIADVLGKAVLSVWMDDHPELY
jgi:hypothetical protein